jgi:hypothetical protein
LTKKPNGCVVLLLVDDSLNIVGYKWFGEKIGLPFADVSALAISKHTKADSKGYKAEREGLRRLKHSQMENCASLEVVVERMFY